MAENVSAAIETQTTPTPIPETPSVGLATTPSPAESKIETTPSQAAVPEAPKAPEPTPDYRQLTQAQIDSIAANARREGYQRGMNASLKQSPTAPEPTPEERAKIEQVVNLVADQRMQKAMAEKTTNELMQKIEIAKTKYSDFTQVVENGLQLGASDPLNLKAEVLKIANSFPNSGDLLYQLAKDPAKLSVITNSLVFGSPNGAFQAMQKLSQDILSQENKSKSQKAPEPLSPIEPSNIGLGSGESSISERRKLPLYYS